MPSTVPMHGEIFIYSAPKHSGKTSALLKWSARKNDVFGMLTPDISGVRYFFDVGTGRSFQMEAAEDESAVIAVGKYRFSKSAFDRAIDILRDIPLQQSGWLIIDEAGPLELQGKGFSGIIFHILSDATRSIRVILVVREELTEKICAHFQIAQWERFDPLTIK